LLPIVVKSPTAKLVDLLHVDRDMADAQLMLELAFTASAPPTRRA